MGAMTDSRTIELQPFTVDDIDRLIGWIPSREFLLQWAGIGFNHPLDRRQLQNHIAKARAQPPVELIFKAVLQPPGVVIGHGELGSIDRDNRSARLKRILVGPSGERRSGYGAAIVSALLELAFEHLELHRVELYVLDINQAAIGCYRKLGFREEGLVREAYLIENRFVNYWIMSMLEDEWPGRRGVKVPASDNVGVCCNGHKRMTGRMVSPFEFWPPALFYIPVGLYYLWLSLRFLGPTLPTAANPSIYAGGMIGESKSQILSLVPRDRRESIAPWTVLEIPTDKPPVDELLAEAERMLGEAGLAYPIVAKPDIGQRGDGVRPVREREALREYLERFPPGETIMLQELADYPCEAGVLYFRRPGDEHGGIFSITIKEFPCVIGDGRRTLHELILNDPRARIISDVYFARHDDRLDTVISDGERYPLVFAGNHCKGAVFRDGSALASHRLLRGIENVAASMPDFHFGRFDIRFRDAESLERGEEMRIVEINGAGSEATHIWDSEVTLGEAYSTLFKQFRLLFEIGAANRKLGHKPLGFFRFVKDFFSYLRRAGRYPSAW